MLETVALAYLVGVFLTGAFLVATLKYASREEAENLNVMMGVALALVWPVYWTLVVIELWRNR